ncbi:PREDICTED: kinesin-like protein KIF21A [Amphimedon queenslandica]|uniref:Kinesin motor domain-containing protein n=1 Tax=Amphimedon queenslandica TaxID=400682 RepID=A0A1X7UVT9_AMPQE|nr:PREDICTED: kinesin-like protein KIF21A [Amphimedon queenslandica]|eukprot:XP_019852103.1 PREDICTED: kinesin-like protein KIF21A [Amphimedon queenslandica]
MDRNDQDTSVKVAVRIRPQNAKEQVDMCRVCTFVTPGEPQVVLGRDKAFTYDYVFDTGTEQVQLYTSCVEKLVEGCFSGLNATVLAYGQTGSGKTYTMGTGFDVTVLPDEQGVVPRAVHHLFNGINSRIQDAIKEKRDPPQFDVSAQFLELYNEEIIDLFDPSRDTSNSKRLKIHETHEGIIYVDGAVVQSVKSESETLDALKRGALSRTVGSTNMNAQSSRSHAIFTISVSQKRPVQLTDASDSAGSQDWETLTAKFHFVDLAGSERLKRTGATGERAKEGISINCGLLALGNVISALGDKTKRGCHVPYRDSKVTRLLQDSLGGNSQTLMIACVSPSDRDFMETLNTLKYANRARNIKNKVSVNQDKNSVQMAALHRRIQELEQQVQEFQSGRLVVTESGSVVINDLANENTMLKAENDKLRVRIKKLQELLNSQTERLASIQAEKEMLSLGGCYDESTGQVMSVERTQDNSSPQFQETLQQYLHQIEELRSKLFLVQSQVTSETIPNMSHSTLGHPLSSSSSSVLHTPVKKGQTSQGLLPPPELVTSELIQTARDDINKLEQQLSSRSKLVKWKKRARIRKRSRSMSPERMSDVEVWVSKSETDLLSNKEQYHTDKDLEKGEECDTDTEVDDSNTDDEDTDMEEDANSVIWSSCDSNDESDSETASIATSIVELTSEMNIKQQLVDQLEKAQRSLHSLRSQYEEKMVVLQTQIRAIESERDKIIKDLASSRQSEVRDEKIKEMKEKYETQLNGLKKELKHLEIAKRDHTIALKKNVQQETELRKLRSDLSNLKNQKVGLLKQLKKETSISKKNAQKNEKELAKLRKDHRKKENQIRNLQADARKKEIMLKRKNEEVQALRRQQSAKDVTAKKERPLTAPPVPSPQVSRKDPNAQPAAKKAKLGRRQSSMFTSDSARRKWRKMEVLIKRVIDKHQTMNLLESDLDRWLLKRDELSERSDQLKLQKETLLQATEDSETLASLEEEYEALSAQINWTNDSIDKLQEEIVAFEDIKTESDTADTTALIHTCSTREAKYLLEHIVNMTIELGTQASQKDVEARSLKMRLATSETHAELIKMYSSPHFPQSPLVINSRTVTKIKPTCAVTTPAFFPASSQCKLDYAMEDDTDFNTTITCNPENSNIDDQQQEEQFDITVCEFHPEESFSKHRRRTAVPEEIKEAITGPRPSLPLPFPSTQPVSMRNLEMTSVSDSNEGISCQVLQSDSGSICQSWPSPPSLSRRNTEIASPSRQNSLTLTKKRSAPSLSVESAQQSRPCPGSPSSSHNTGVLRLTSLQESNSTQEIRDSFDVEKVPRTSGKQLVCTHTVRGHASGVLSVTASNILLFTGSQDCTAKVWDYLQDSQWLHYLVITVMFVKSPFVPILN